MIGSEPIDHMETPQRSPDTDSVSSELHIAIHPLPSTSVSPSLLLHSPTTAQQLAVNEQVALGEPIDTPIESIDKEILEERSKQLYDETKQKTVNSRKRLTEAQ